MPLHWSKILFNNKRNVPQDNLHSGRDFIPVHHGNKLQLYTCSLYRTTRPKAEWRCSCRFYNAVQPSIVIHNSRNNGHHLQFIVKISFEKIFFDKTFFRVQWYRNSHPAVVWLLLCWRLFRDSLHWIGWIKLDLSHNLLCFLVIFLLIHCHVAILVCGKTENCSVGGNTLDLFKHRPL
jgi:hypothetical protein